MYTYFIYISDNNTWIAVSEAEYNAFKGKKIRTA